MRLIDADIITSFMEYMKSERRERIWVNQEVLELIKAQPTVMAPYRIAFNVLDSLSSAYYGKQMYFLRDNGPIYSRVSSKFLSGIADAVNEFYGVLKGETEADDGR